MLSSGSSKQICLFLASVSICVTGMLMPKQAMGLPGDPGAEDLIRSAMVYNFCKFVQWPDDTQDTIVLGVLSDPGSQTDFSSITGKMVQDATIEIRLVTSVDEIRNCDLIFIDEGQSSILREAFAVSQSEAVLTISEMDEFCSQGGIIQLVHRRGKLRFFINRSAARDSHLVLSSQLLKMAKIVEGK